MTGEQPAQPVSYRLERDEDGRWRLETSSGPDQGLVRECAVLTELLLCVLDDQAGAEDPVIALMRFLTNRVADRLEQAEADQPRASAYWDVVEAGDALTHFLDRHADPALVADAVEQWELSKA